LIALLLIGAGLAAALLLWMLLPAGAPGSVGAAGPLWRSPFDLPAGFWVPWVVGLGAWLISAWVFALRPRDTAIRLFALSGTMTLLFTFAGAVDYLAEPLVPEQRHVAAILNTIGASGFGLAVITLFAIYPGPLPRARWLVAAALAGFGGWTLAILFGPPEGLVAVQAITFCEMLAIMALALAQALRPWRDPGARAIAVWLGISVLIGAGPFIGLVAAPMTFGFAKLINENLAFASFLLFYLGIAAGLMRYRLFDLGRWSYALLLYALVGAGLMLFDLALVSILALSPAAAFAATLGIVAVTWLPLRDVLWHRFHRRARPDELLMFGSVVESVLRPTASGRAEGWRALLDQVYQPLEIREAPDPGPVPRLEDDGRSLTVPAVLGAPPLILRFRQRGQALFSRRDGDLAGLLVQLATYVESSRAAYDQGVSEERLRIARDIHDNIGAQLMQALHSDEPPRKNAMIRNSLADLRDIINNSGTPELSLEALLADLRAETGSRLDLHGIALDWQVDVSADLVLAAGPLHSLRSAIREAASNAIKHSGASTMAVMIVARGDTLTVRLADNGRGIPAQRRGTGHGLANIETRFVSLGGGVSIRSDGSGTCIEASLPLARSAVPVAVMERLPQ
jgi:signal transduction histidine kinase